MTTTTNTSKKSLFNGRKMWFIFSAVAAFGVAIVLLLIMSALTAKDTYFVLNQDIPARTNIDVSMLTEIQTSAGSAPPSALDLSDITPETFSLYSLSAGDILTTSNTGDLLSLSAGLPDDFVVTSFIADPSMAAGGNVQRGDYIDIIAVVDDSSVTGEEGPAASYVLQRVLVVDATVNLDSYSGGEEASTTDGSGSTGGETGNTGDPAIRAGVPTMFTVGLSPDNAAVLAVAGQYELYVVLSSAATTEGVEIPGVGEPASGRNIWGNPQNAGEGTDNTFGSSGEVVRPEDEVSTPEGEEEGTVSSPEPTEPPAEEETTE